MVLDLGKWWVQLNLKLTEMWFSLYEYSKHRKPLWQRWCHRKLKEFRSHFFKIVCLINLEAESTWTSLAPILSVRCGFLVSPQKLCPSASSLLVESLISSVMFWVSLWGAFRLLEEGSLKSLWFKLGCFSGRAADGYDDMYVYEPKLNSIRLFLYYSKVF